MARREQSTKPPTSIETYMPNHVGSYCACCFAPYDPTEHIIDFQTLRVAKDKKSFTAQTWEWNATFHISCFRKLCEDGQLLHHLDALKAQCRKYR